MLKMTKMLGSRSIFLSPKYCELWNRITCHHHLTNYSTSMSFTDKPYYISTPIFYVTAAPHIGHLYTSVIADAISRWKKLQEEAVWLSTGTDEHGLKVQMAASECGVDPYIFSDKVSSSYKKLFQMCTVDYDDFIRTTEGRHKETVNHFWMVLKERGYLYKDDYKGWYCVSDEAFLSESEVENSIDADGKNIKVSKISGHVAEWMKEDNYMFRLSEFKRPLQDWLAGGVIYPDIFKSQVEKWLDGLQDLSISRLRSRINWAIPVPDDPLQSIYVWLDALVNYLTVSGYPDKNRFWPADCHIVGKDILKFHSVYWPAFLMAAGLEPPKSIVCHSHWTVDSKKMSKSLGNSVDPFDRCRAYTPDGLRYYLLRAGVLHSDGNYTDKKVVECLNSELSNTLGNLLNRVTARILNPDQTFPVFDANVFLTRYKQADHELLENLAELPVKVAKFFDDFKFYKGIDAIVAQLHATSSFIQYSEPWALYKDPENPTNQIQINNILHVVLQNLRVCGILLQPVVPKISDTLLDRLGIYSHERLFKHVNSELNTTNQVQGNVHMSSKSATFSQIVKKTCGKYSGRDLGLDTGLLFPHIKT